MLPLPWELLPLFFIVALFYSSVGHGGASGYLALFALSGTASPSVVPIALVLNILVASTSFWHYFRGGYFSGRTLLPLVASSMPAAYVGGLIPVSQPVFSFLLGVSLLLAAARVAILHQTKGNIPSRSFSPRSSLVIGGVLGLVSAMIGIGGGVFLSPILILSGWADVKKAAGLSSAFIVVNSLSGLAGHLSHSKIDSLTIVPLALVVLVGGLAGSRIGVFHLKPRILQGVLGIVLVMAGMKLIGSLLHGM